MNKNLLAVVRCTKFKKRFLPFYVQHRPWLTLVIWRWCLTDEGRPGVMLVVNFQQEPGIPICEIDLVNFVSIRDVPFSNNGVEAICACRFHT